ncbi:MAG: FHA domain-containing protein, partial [Bdellovibrionaceae bacterium]|nr:FHA domain-containing protein [Pseudobdellovibrionaceae bacterium]
MWSLRVLNGPQSGQLFNLKDGKNIIGRASTCSIKLMAPGVSKEHCEISISNGKIYVLDLNSSNGTYVNGIRVQKVEIRLGEKFSVYNLFLDIIPTPQVKVNHAVNTPGVNPGVPMPQGVSNLATQNYQQPYFLGQDPQQINRVPQPHLNLVNGGVAETQIQEKNSFGEKIQEYVDTVVLPAVYKLAQTFEFKYVLAGFVGIFIFVVTLLSLFPMISVTRDSIQLEAKKRTISLARALAEANKKAISENSGTSLNTYSIEREEGVKEALIINRADGTIMAPATKSGRSIEIPFVNEVLRSGREGVKVIDSTTIAAGFPIDRYDLDRQEAVPIAYAIVIYDITALSFDVRGEDVLITGAGPIGIMAAVVVRHSGAINVVITDMNPY